MAQAIKQGIIHAADAALARRRNLLRELLQEDINVHLYLNKSEWRYKITMNRNINIRKILWDEKVV